MICKGVEQGDSYRVKVSTSTERLSKILRLLLRRLLKYFCYSLLCFIFFFIIIGVYLLLHARCYSAPEIELRDVTVHTMTVTRTTNPTGDIQDRELNYNITIALSMHNPNSFPGCSIKYHLMVVSTAYRGDVLQQSYFPQEFSQKRRLTQEVVALMNGSHIQLNQPNAAFLEGEVQNKNVLMEVYVDTRFRSSSEGGAELWNHLKCRTVIVTTPSALQAEGALLSKKC